MASLLNQFCQRQNGATAGKPRWLDARILIGVRYVLQRKEAASGFADRDRARQQVKDVTQQLRQNFLDLNSAQDTARTQQLDAPIEQDRLKQLLKLQNAGQNQTARPAN
ncbi:MAG: hypothetical protein WB795_07900 [Candidatus Acidiferrales bacterium]